MPKHKPIRFREPDVPEEIKERIKEFINRHPVATSITKAALGLIVVGGLLTVGAIAPKAISHLVGAVNRHNKNNRYKDLWRSFYKLKREKAIKYIGEKNDESVYEITERGKKRLVKFCLDTIEIMPPKKWTGEWRVIIFDIPEKFGRARRALQGKLKDMGCYPLQRSVWVHPFPCEAEVNFICDVFEVGRFVHIMRTKDIPLGEILSHFEDLLQDI